MPLSFSIIDEFLKDNGEALSDKTLARRGRRRVFGDLYRRLGDSIRAADAFESEFSSYVNDKVVAATGFDELMRLHRLASTEIRDYFLEEESVVDVHDLFRMVRDGITIRVLQLVEDEMERDGYGRPPTGYVWVGLGSEGRDEQTMVTDQDNMIIFGEDVKEGSFNEYLREECDEYLRGTGTADGFEKVAARDVIAFYYKVFAEKTVDRLYDVGFDKCTGNVMPSNQKWRGSLRDWRERLEQRFFFERGIFEPLDVVIMSDARFIAGSRPMLGDLLRPFFRALTDHKNVMKDFIQAAVLMPTALSFFGNFKVEKNGDRKGMLNLKLHGWAPLILAVRMLALSNGVFEPNTLRRIRLLREMNAIKKDMEMDLVDAYLVFVKFRIMNQVNIKDVEDHAALNYLKPDMLGAQEQERLRKAMRAVEALQKYIQTVLLFGQAV